VSNNFIGELLYQKGVLQTTKSIKSGHGIGLNSIRKIINNYDGTMEISHSDNNFTVEILMYI
jgi:sensor histidine kinase YesM